MGGESSRTTLICTRCPQELSAPSHAGRLSRTRVVISLDFVFTYTVKDFGKLGTVLESEHGHYLFGQLRTGFCAWRCKFIGWASRLTSLGTHPTHPAVSLLWSLLVQFQASRGSSEREPCWFGKGKAWGGCVSLELGWASFLPS